MKLILFGKDFGEPQSVAPDLLPESRAVYVIIEETRPRSGDYQTVYVGMAENLRERIRGAVSDPRSWHGKATGKQLLFFCGFEDAGQAREFEGLSIRQLQPRYNRGWMFPAAYFDLNAEPTETLLRLGDSKEAKVDTVRSLDGPEATTEVLVSAPSGFLTTLEQVALYTFMVVGILFSDAVQATTNEAASLDAISWKSFLLSLVVGFAVFPKIYKEIMQKGNATFFLKICLCVQNGVFWRVIIDAFAGH